MKRLSRRDNPWRTVRRPTVFIMPSATNRSVRWLLCDRNGPGMVTHENSPEELADSLEPLSQRQGNQLDGILVLPAEAVLHTRVTVPRAQRRYLQQSLPYVAEAQLAYPVESQHVVAGASLGGDDLQALVVSCAWMDWVFALPDQIPGVRLAGVYAESQILSAGAACRGEYRCLWTGERVLLSSPGAGVVCGRSDISRWLLRGPADRNGARSVHPICQDQSEDTVATLMAELETLASEVAPPRRLETDPLEYWARRVLQRPADMVNLLTGRYSLTKGRVGPGHVGVSAAAAAAMFMVGLVVWQYGQIERAEARLDAVRSATQVLYQRAVPSDLPAYQPGAWRGVVESALVAGRAGNSGSPAVLRTLTRLNAGLTGQSVALDEVRYSSATGLMQLVVRADGTPDLDRFRASLEQQSLEVTYSASQTGDRFRGDFRVTVPGGGA